MTNEELQERETLINSPNLSMGEKARLKMLNRKFSKHNQTAQEKPAANVFATTPTTKLNPIPVRFSQNERTGLANLVNDITSQHKELVITELGSLKDVSQTKLIRAAILLLQEHSHQDIIAAIKEVKLNMVR